MNAERLLALYDRIADAPDAVARLRRFILDLVVRGKLVPQAPNDGVAPRFDPSLPDDLERPFDIPTAWNWARLHTLGRLKGGGTPSKTRAEFWVGDIPWVSPKDMKCDYITATQMHISAAAVSGSAVNMIESESILFVVRGMILSHSFPVAIAKIPLTINQDMKALVLKKPAMAAYVLLALKGTKPEMLKRVQRSSHGTGRLEGADYRDFLVPIPPLAEQHRIVAKVDELMALCDRLEAARETREKARDRFAAAGLARLRAPDADPATFADHARFAIENLAALTTRPDQIKALRQTILDLAVRGKLVPQDKADKVSPLPALRQFSVASGMDDEVFLQFQGGMTLPMLWQIAPLAQLAENIVDCPHTTPKWTETGEICIRTNQLRPGLLDLSESKFVSAEAYRERIERLEPKADDILYSREGGILGIACRVPFGTRLCLGQRLMLIRTGSQIRPDFLEFVLNSPFITDIAKACTTGGAAPRVNMSTVRAYPIPLPPLAEQHRIVAKVDALMALCDRLEASLDAAADTRRRLLDALIAEALAPTTPSEREAVA